MKRNDESLSRLCSAISYSFRESSIVGSDKKKLDM